MFVRYSWSHNPEFIPGPFTGFADGGGFGTGDQIVNTQGAAISYTHSFSPTLINEARVGFNREHTSRVQPYGDDTTDIPAQFGIQGVLQTAGNGGLPYLGIGGLSQLGSAEWLISDRYSNTIQFTENLTKIYGTHTFKGGFGGKQVGFPGRRLLIRAADMTSTGSIHRFRTSPTAARGGPSSCWPPPRRHWRTR